MGISTITEDYSHLGVGELWLRRKGSTEPYRPIGNANQVQMAIEQNTITQGEFRSPGGGARNEINRIVGVAANLQVFDLSPENIAMVLYGDASAVAATDATQKKERVTVRTGGLIPLEYMNPSNVSVTKDPDGTPVTAEAGTDYEVRAGGVFLFANVQGGVLTDGDEIEIAYDHGAQYVIESMVNSGYEFEASFRGYNEARAKHFSLDMYRLRFPPTEGLDWVGEEFATLSTAPKLLADTTKPAGKSQFFRATMEQ